MRHCEFDSQLLTGYTESTFLLIQSKRSASFKLGCTSFCVVNYFHNYGIVKKFIMISLTGFSEKDIIKTTQPFMPITETDREYPKR